MASLEDDAWHWDNRSHTSAPPDLPLDWPTEPRRDYPLPPRRRRSTISLLRHPNVGHRYRAPIIIEDVTEDSDENESDNDIESDSENDTENGMEDIEPNVDDTEYDVEDIEDKTHAWDWFGLLPPILCDAVYILAVSLIGADILRDLGHYLRLGWHGIAPARSFLQDVFFAIVGVAIILLQAVSRGIVGTVWIELLGAWVLLQILLWPIRIFRSHLRRYRFRHLLLFLILCLLPLAGNIAFYHRHQAIMILRSPAPRPFMPSPAYTL